MSSVAAFFARETDISKSQDFLEKLLGKRLSGSGKLQLLKRLQYGCWCKYSEPFEKSHSD